jgi:predicted AAA+ superfamily ATPase
MPLSGVDYRPRLIDGKIKNFLRTFGAVCVEGPKWCGKTWTSSQHAQSSFFLGNPSGNFQNRRLAELDPSLVLAGKAPRLLDEWQEVPSLWDAVRHEVDQSRQKGRFILTGSATPVHKGILHSGAGRIAKVRMRPMSLFETGESSGAISLRSLFSGGFVPILTGEVKLDSLIGSVLRGGWPASIGMEAEQTSLIPLEYIKAILDDDAHRIDGVRRDLTKMRLLLRSLARNESTTISVRKLKNDIREVDDETLDESTLASYLDVLSRLFLIDDQPPFHTNIRSSVRLKQAEKRHLADPSLAAALLGANRDKLIGDLQTFGFLFEALCVRDLRIYAESSSWKLYHYQDYENCEIDAVVETDSGAWGAFEIKLGANEIDAAAENLKRVNGKIAADQKGKQASILCVICGMSNAAYTREDGVLVVPITALRD